MPKGIPLTKEEQAKRRHEIFHQVVNVFLKKGFQETSMRGIAPLGVPHPEKPLSRGM